LLASGDANPAFMQAAPVSNILATLPPALEDKLEASIKAGAPGPPNAAPLAPVAQGVVGAGVRPPGRVSVAIVPV
jgi:hypothetical protein